MKLMAYKDVEKQRAAWRAYWHRSPEKHREFRNLKRRQTSEWFNALKADYHCVICGESESCCIDFHHVDEQGKSCNVADFTRYGFSRERILAEIGKCVALCANCHRKLHAGKAQLP